MRTRRLGTVCDITTGDGVVLAVREYGSRAAEHTVVLLHGWCMDKDSWHLQIAELTRRWGTRVRVIAYDHRGHGESASAPMHTYRIERLADDLAEVLTALEVTGSLTLAGHSMGGMAALAYLGRPVARRPVQPDNLVLVATAAGKLPERGIGRLLATPACDVVYELLRRGPRVGTGVAARLITEPICAALTRSRGFGQLTREALAAAATVAASPLTTKVGFLRALKEHDQHRALGAITAATTVVSGGADLLTPRAHADDLVAGIPGATHLHYPAAGHMLLHEVAQEVSEAISAAVGRRQLALAC